MTPEELTQSLKSEAAGLGFALAGICPAVAPARLGRLHEWLERGYAGEMRYFNNRREAYSHPASVLEGVRSIAMLATPYLTSEPAPVAPGQGRVSRYAWSGVDYHDVIRERMEQLIQSLKRRKPDGRFRAVIDTAPLLERDFAALAGLGWQGKNTLLLNKTWGSWFFLSALLTDLVLEFDQPFTADHCGTCTACLDACPTSAFVQPGVLDANRCISYLTIEHRSSIPAELRPQMGDWVFGCDVCQDVCPWNRKSPPVTDSKFFADESFDPLELSDLFYLTDQEFQNRFGKTPLARPRRRGLLRNAAIGLGNQRSKASIPALTRGLSDSEPLVRGACAWALGRIGDGPSIAALVDRLTVETDAEVRGEIESALAGVCDVELPRQS